MKSTFESNLNQVNLRKTPFTRTFQSESTQYCIIVSMLQNLLFEETNDVLAIKDVAFYFYII